MLWYCVLISCSNLKLTKIGKSGVAISKITPATKHLTDGDGELRASPPNSIGSNCEEMDVIASTNGPTASDLPTFDDMGDDMEPYDMVENNNTIISSDKEVVTSQHKYDDMGDNVELFKTGEDNAMLYEVPILLDDIQKDQISLIRSENGHLPLHGQSISNKEDV